MIVIKVELWPYGMEDAKHSLAEATIENRGRDEAGYKYRAVLRERSDPELGIRRRDQTISISGYDRRQSVWNLILSMLVTARREHPLKCLGGYQPAHAWTEDTAADSEALALFLDVLPSAWGLSERQIEQLLSVAPGWLRAWRNHEVRLDSPIRTRIWQLGVLQKRMGLVSSPEDYSTFWHRPWAETSPLGRRSPWQAFEQEGDNALRIIQQFLTGGLQ